MGAVAASYRNRASKLIRNQERRTEGGARDAYAEKDISPIGDRWRVVRFAESLRSASQLNSDATSANRSPLIMQQPVPGQAQVSELVPDASSWCIGHSDSTACCGSDAETMYACAGPTSALNTNKVISARLIDR